MKQSPAANLSSLISLPAIRHWAAVALITSVLGGTSNAQWNVVGLHPVGATRSQALGVGGNQQVGTTSFGGAILWSGTAASWVNLNPPGSAFSTAFGVSSGQQVGWAFIAGGVRAGTWGGTAASWVSLHPPGAFYSAARGGDGGWQVGEASFGEGGHAGLWAGTAASFVDLHPAGASDSSANGVGGGQQVGYAVVRGRTRARLWSGSPDSWVNLHPTGWGESESTGVSSRQQVGYAMLNDGERHAGLWTGTAASWVDLHPANAEPRSWATGVSGGYQVGFASISGADHAGMWSGRASSWVDLHALLPGSFLYSQASGIHNDVHTIRIVGQGYNTATNRVEALMWVAPVLHVSIDVKPGSLANTINLGSNGSIPVAVLSNADFDATQVDPASVRLANSIAWNRGNGMPLFSFEDVNGDGLMDLVVQIGTHSLQLTAGDTEAVLQGSTFGGQLIRGVDHVKIVPQSGMIHARSQSGNGGHCPSRLTE